MSLLKPSWQRNAEIKSAGGRIFPRVVTCTLEEKNGESQAGHPPAPQCPTQFYPNRNLPLDPGERAPKSSQSNEESRVSHTSRPPDRFVRRSRESSHHLKGPVEKQIYVIVGGPAASGDSSLARRAYASAEVQKRPYVQSNPEITFESKGEYPNHDDALVITARIVNARVKCIMIDTGSSADIFYFDAFLKLDMTNQDLIPMTSTLTRFIGTQ
ncbi:hypothetical protein BHE74_00023793 [Ensete ventricosum]|nr:hypothetical protein BHE74_00023793 [Ensete ventricosum]